MARRAWLMLVSLLLAVALPVTAAAQDTEPYSGGEVPATTLQPATTEPAATVLGVSVTQAERLPNTGLQSEWLAIGGLLLIVVGVSLVWFVRSQRFRTDA